ncbi:MAG: PfkB family carbohydrate kinase [Treponema sp.]|jgi:ribokinase|nr:PfkB family carbohydrate kinase [Treponema sp.]
MKILVFGSLNIDLIFPVDHVVRPGETIGSASLTRSAGGKGANQAAALAKAGMDVYMAGKIGADGEFLLRLLESYGVDTGCVSRYEGATGQAIIQLDRDKQNAILLFSGGNGRITLDEIKGTIGKFDRGDTIVLQNEVVRMAEIMETAHERGLRICLNPSPWDTNIGALPLDLADLFFVNEIEGAAMADLSGAPPRRILDRLAERFPTAEIILTAGKEGAYYGFQGIREKGDIVDLPVADTTGAGDTFTGYFLAARSRNFSVGEALAAACKAASIAVSRMGAMEAIPLGTEVF